MSENEDYRMIEKGPDDKFHFPAFKTGCYYNRGEDCCWLCFIRLGLSPLHQPHPDDVNFTSKHPLIGTSVRIPMVDQHEETVTHVEGTVIEVYQPASSPEFITVRLNNGSTLSLGVKPSLHWE